MRETVNVWKSCASFAASGLDLWDVADMLPTRSCLTV